MLTRYFTDVERPCVQCRRTLSFVWLFSCEPRSLRGEDVCRLEVLDHQCLGGIAKIGWSDRVSYVLVMILVLGGGLEGILSHRIEHRGICWSEHVLRMANTLLAYRARFSLLAFVSWLRVLVYGFENRVRISIGLRQIDFVDRQFCDPVLFSFE